MRREKSGFKSEENELKELVHLSVELDAANDWRHTSNKALFALLVLIFGAHAVVHAFLQGVVDPAYAGKIADDGLYGWPPRALES